MCKLTKNSLSLKCLTFKGTSHLDSPAHVHLYTYQYHHGASPGLSWTLIRLHPPGFRGRCGRVQCMGLDSRSKIRGSWVAQSLHVCIRLRV